MTNTTQTPLTAEHMTLATAWAQYIGQRGTVKQTEKIARYLNAETLRVMLAKRGIELK